MSNAIAGTGTGKPRGYEALRRASPESRELVEAALHGGWWLEPTDRGHLLLQHPDGRRIRVKAEPDKAALALLRRMTRELPA
jgi:hypothetical protein